MFEVKFTTFSKRENSTKRPDTWAATLNCKMLEPSTVTTPRLEIVNVANVHTYTYAYIAAFSRYYFVKEWTNDGVKWIADLVVDVLASYKTEIGNSTQYVLRAASTISPKVIDTYYKATLNAEYKSSRGTVSFVKVDTTTGCYLVHNMGLFNSSVGTPENYLIFSKSEYEKLIKLLVLDQSLPLLSADYLARLIEVKWFPFNYDQLPAVMFPASTVSLNNILPQDVLTCKRITGNGLIYGLGSIDIPRPSWDSPNRLWARGAPFAEYAFSWFPFGIIELDSGKIAADSGSSIGMFLTIDARTGSAKLELQVGSGYMAADVALMAANEAVHASATNGNAILSAGAGLASAALGAYTGQYALAAGGIASAIGSIEGMRKGIHTVKGNTSSRATITAEPQIFATFYEPTADNHEEKGYPVCQTLTVNTLNGFIMCAEPDIELSCTEAERLKVGAYLTGGFYYE